MISAAVFELVVIERTSGPARGEVSVIGFGLDASVPVSVPSPLPPATEEEGVIVDPPAATIPGRCW